MIRPIKGYKVNGFQFISIISSEEDLNKCLLKWVNVYQKQIDRLRRIATKSFIIQLDEWCLIHDIPFFYLALKCWVPYTLLVFLNRWLLGFYSLFNPEFYAGFLQSRERLFSCICFTNRKTRFASKIVFFSMFGWWNLINCKAENLAKTILESITPETVELFSAQHYQCAFHYVCLSRIAAKRTIFQNIYKNIEPKIPTFQEVHTKTINGRRVAWYQNLCQRAKALQPLKYIIIYECNIIMHISHTD